MDLKAHCDIKTGEIHGCKKGSWKWWHEKGHLEFNKDENKSFLIMLRGFAFDFWMLAVMFAIVFKAGFYVSVLLWGFYIFVGLYEEWWCNQYANKKIKI